MDAPPPGTPAESGDAVRLRVYEVWRGSNKFLLQGRFIFGPDVRSLFLTVFLIVAPVSIFCIFVARKLMDDFNHWGILIMVVAAVFTFYDIILLLLTSGRDPGIIPRNARPPDSESYDGNTDLSDGQTPRLRFPRIKDVVINGITVKIKYCDTCMLYRPPRCSHCSICNNCVERFDHHCPWVGQCIGRRNYRFFYMFVFSSTLLCIYVFAFCWVYIIRIKDAEQINVWKAMKKTPASIALIAYSFVSVWFVGGLSVFHLYLIGTNQTTYENFRYRYDRRENPYNKGVVQNFVEVFFSSIPPSKNNFRAWAPLDQVYTSQSNSASFIGPNMGRPIRNIETERKHVGWDRRAGVSHDLESGQDDMPEGKISRLIGETLPGLAGETSDLESGLNNMPEGKDRLSDSPGDVPSEGSEGRAVLNPLWSDTWRSGSLDISPEVLALGPELGESNQRGSHSDSIASVDR